MRFPPHKPDRTALSTAPLLVRRSARHARIAGVLCAACAAIAFMPACSSSRSSGKWFSRPKTSRDYLDMALEAELPDDRRRGVTGLAAGRDGSSDWAIKVYDTIARTDVDPMVRCAAVRALGPVAGPDQVALLLRLLSSASRRYDDIRPAPGTVRWEAAKVLLAVVQSGGYDESQRMGIVDLLLDRLARDNNRNVRLAVIETLGYFAQAPVPESLVDAMETDDFAVKQAAESSLIALTGHTHQHDPQAWREWLAATPDPFMDAGKVPPELEAGSSSRRIRWEWPY